MKVSVITVSFNSAATIGDTLRSVAAQDYPDIEHIVIDGASTDATLEIVRREGSHVAKVISEADGGIYDAMNKGLRLATGEFVGFLNADDLLADSGAVARLAKVIKDIGANAVFSDLAYVRPDDTNAVLRYWNCGGFSRRSLRLGWMPPHPTFYVSCSLLPEIGEFDCSLRIAADYDFMLRTLWRRDITTAHVPGVMVRMRTGGVSNQSLIMMWRKSKEDLLALRRNGIGGLPTLVCKNLRKLPQFFRQAPLGMSTNRS